MRCPTSRRSRRCSARLSRSCPAPTWPDLARLVGFYRDVLGFAETYRFPEAGAPQFVTVALPDGSQLGLGAEDAEEPTSASGRFDLCVYATDCDAAVERLRQAGARITAEPVDMPWGERMARAQDPDGNRLLIMARL